MTPDDMEGRLAELADWLHPRDTEPTSKWLWQDAADLRALLLDYQERGRALEAASPVVPVGREEIARIIRDTIDCDFDGTVFRHDEAADAIIAALGTTATDTGREDETDGPGGQGAGNLTEVY
jgi:hypothetical protein